MDEEYQKKLKIAKMAHKSIMQAFKEIQSRTTYKISFCWDECLHVDDEFFNYTDFEGE